MKNSARILSLAVAAALSASMLSACQSSERQTYFEENSAGEIVDSALLDKIAQESQPLNSVIGDHINYGQQGGAMAMSDKYVYIFWFMGDMGYIKVDLQTGEAIPLCEVAGCTHDYNLFPNCINNSLWDNVRPVGDALWHTEENKLLETKDGETKVLYENNYCNKEEESYYKELGESNKKYNISYYIVDDDYIYLFGAAHVTLLDINTFEEVKTIDYSAEYVARSWTVYNGKMYFISTYEELFVLDLESGEVTKLGDQVYGIKIQDDVLYYVTFVDGGRVLYSADLDFKNPKLIAKGFYIEECAIKDGKVFYIPNSDETIIMCHDIASGEETLVYDGDNRMNALEYADFCDRIFFYTDSAVDQETYEPYNVLISVRSDGSDLWVRRFDGETWKN